jgi:hypothetical protein
MDNYVENKEGGGKYVNAFNRVSDTPNQPPEIFEDEEVEKTPLAIGNSAGGENTGEVGDDQLADDGSSPKGAISTGPNVGAPVNGTLSDSETSSTGNPNIPPGGRGGLSGVSPAADKMQYSFEGGREYKGSMVQGKAAVTMFGSQVAGPADNPGNEKVVSNPNTNTPTYV